jgi:acetolactate synthase-1/2/3 large subunit
MPTHAEVMAKTLAEGGVKYVFGLPGGEVTAFMDACRRCDIRFVLAGHESSAAIIAQVVGQMSGTPGVCTATLGPGATNLATGIANAFLDRSPVLAVVAQIPAPAYPSMTHQRVAIHEMYAPITKRVSVLGEGNTGDVVRESLALALAPRPGPVMLILPSDVAVEECASPSSVPPSEVTAGAATPVRLAEIQARISRAERPLVLVGLGAPPQSAPAVRAFVNALGAPFLITPKARGIVAEDSPLFLGVASGMAIDRDIVATIRAADLVIGIGFDPVEADKTWFTEIEAVAIDSVSMVEGAYRPLEEIGDIATLLAELQSSLAGPKPWPADLLAARRRAIERTPMVAANGASPLGLLQGLRSRFPADGILTCDVGSHKLLAGQFWRSNRPGTFLMSNGLSGMGFGIPAAIGAQLVHPDRAVMALVGDGGMLMMMHDLALVRELNLPLAIVVLKDNSLSLIRLSQERRGYPPCGVDFTAPDFPAIAKAFGIAGWRARSVAEAQAAVESALTRREPLLLEVPVDMREYYELI